MSQTSLAFGLGVAVGVSTLVRGIVACAATRRQSSEKGTSRGSAVLHVQHVLHGGPTRVAVRARARWPMSNA